MAARISICMPTYQGERYLQQALDSASALPGNDIEILACDDGSRDGTWDILEKHRDHDPRLRILRNPVNLGLVANWNHCLQCAKGEWIKFLFQDDFLLPCFESVVRPLLSCAPDFLVTARTFRIEEDADPEIAAYLSRERYWLNQIADDQEVVTADDFACIAAQMFGYNFLGEPSNVLFRRRAIFQIGVFNPHFTQYPDLDFYYRLGQHCGVMNVSTACSTFRVHGKSTTANNHRQNILQSTDLDLLLLQHELLYNPQYRSLLEKSVSLGLETRTIFHNKIQRLHQIQPSLQSTDQAAIESLCLAYPRIRADF